MNAMYTLVLTHGIVYVTVYTEEFLLYYVTHGLGKTKCQWRMKQYKEHTVKNSTYFTALSSLSTGPIKE